MNTARDQIRQDMDKRPEDLQQEADDVRQDMERTVDELANQFSPGELFNQAMGMLRGSGDSNFIQNLSTQVQNNPVPALLAGVSLTWLISASKQPAAKGASSSGNSHGVQSARDTISSGADQARASARNMMEGAKEKQQHMAESAGDMKERLSEGSHQMMDSARAGAGSARDRYNHMLQEQPLVLGAMAIAVGAALGALLPRTDSEDSAMGEVSDEQKASVKHRAEEIKEQAEAKVEGKLDQQRAQSDSSSQQPTDETPHTHQSGDSAGKSGSGGMAGSERTDSEGPRQNATPPPARSRGTTPASSDSPLAAGASGTPGSPSSAGRAEEGVPVAKPSSVPNHPDTNPPSLNDHGDEKR